MVEDQQGKAFVCSSLPIGILNQNLIKWNVDFILLNNKIHLKTYEHLRKNHPTIKIKVLPGGVFKNFLFLTFFFIQIKIKKQKLYFFHECCAVLFDALIQVFKPKSCYYPQVELVSFPNIKKRVFSKEGFLTLFSLQYNNFDTRLNNHSSNINYHGIIWSIKKYNRNVKMFNIQDSKIRIKEITTKNRKALILISKDVFLDDDMNNVLTKAIEILKNINIKLYIKNHPNSSSRLFFKSDFVTELDPTVPFELLDQKYLFTLAFYSTSLIRTNSHAISLVYLVKNKPDSFNDRLKHLLNHPNYKTIFFPKSFVELNNYFDEFL